MPLPNDIIYDEKELLDLVAKGDEYAFSKLFEHYRNRIYSIAFKLTQSTSVAEEIVQDVFLKIWIKRVDLIEIQNFSAYLFIVARNDVYRVLKKTAKSYKMVLLTDNDQLFSHNNSENYIMDKEYDSLLQKAVNQLPKQQKQVYTLMKEQGLKREEAADYLDLQPETVKFHLAQAMKNIRSFCAIHLDVLTGVTFFLFSTS